MGHCCCTDWLFSHFIMQWMWKQCEHWPQTNGQSSPGNLQSEQQASKGILQIPQESSLANHRHVATAFQRLIRTFKPVFVEISLDSFTFSSFSPLISPNFVEIPAKKIALKNVLLTWTFYVSRRKSTFKVLAVSFKSFTATAKASGLTPASIKRTQIAKLSRSKPVFKIFDISQTTKKGNLLKQNQFA